MTTLKRESNVRDIRFLDKTNVYRKIVLKHKNEFRCGRDAALENRFRRKQHEF